MSDKHDRELEELDKFLKTPMMRAIGPDKYLLKGREVIRCADLFFWAREFEKLDRQLKLTRVGPYFISTVFLGLDHSLRFLAPLVPDLMLPPVLLFETMAWIKVPEYETELGYKMDREFVDVQERCATYAESLLQHQSVIDQLRESSDDIEELHDRENPPKREI